jgi:hypothetical protein
MADLNELNKGKHMMITSKYLTLLFFLILISSCTDKKKVNQNFESSVIKQDSVIKPQYHLYFLKNKKNVEKIIRDSIYTAVIEYHSPLDTIITELFETDKYPQRAIYFFKVQNKYEEIELDTNSGKNNEFYEVLEVYKNNYKFDTLYPASHIKIPIFDLKFTRAGTNYINGFIEDMAYVQVSDTSKVRIIENHSIISHSFEVIANY